MKKKKYRVDWSINESDVVFYAIYEGRGNSKQVAACKSKEMAQRICDLLNQAEEFYHAVVTKLLPKKSRKKR